MQSFKMLKVQSCCCFSEVISKFDLKQEPKTDLDPAMTSDHPNSHIQQAFEFKIVNQLIINGCKNCDV